MGWNIRREELRTRGPREWACPRTIQGQHIISTKFVSSSLKLERDIIIVPGCSHSGSKKGGYDFCENPRTVIIAAIRRDSRGLSFSQVPSAVAGSLSGFGNEKKKIDKRAQLCESIGAINSWVKKPEFKPPRWFAIRRTGELWIFISVQGLKTTEIRDCYRKGLQEKKSFISFTQGICLHPRRITCQRVPPPLSPFPTLVSWQQNCAFISIRKYLLSS